MENPFILTNFIDTFSGKRQYICMYSIIYNVLVLFKIPNLLYHKRINLMLLLKKRKTSGMITLLPVNLIMACKTNYRCILIIRN